MNKRPPEMETLARVPHYDVRLARNDGFGSYAAPAYLAEHVDAAIRSLRVKLFRERAMRYERRGIDPIAFFLPAREGETGERWVMVSYDKAAAEFRRIADAIERGEK